MRLREACGHDDDLFARVLPFAGLIRETFGKPVVITTNSVYVTQGSDRRSTGTHYTPRSLTEPIVRRTLEPVVYRGVSEGVDPSPETLKTPEEILALKICDMTTGSGAFLVEACRYLSARLVEAWTRKADADPDALLVLPGATPSTGHAGERLLGKVPPLLGAEGAKDPDELLTIARRAIVDRCLYGVDKNPMAVEMAKLSLWLITMERDRPFTFVDHAIKAGDSLVGVDMDQLRTWSLDRSGGNNLDLFMEQQIRRATDLRLTLESLPEQSIDDVRHKERIHRDAEAALARVKLAGDLIVAPSFKSTKAKEQDELRGKLQSSFIALPNDENDAVLRAEADAMLGDVKPFHWPLEFPEVFQRESGGFDAIVGNPPFMGGSKITAAQSVRYRELIVNTTAHGNKGPADLAVYFLLRASHLVRKRGTIGYVTTNTVGQGDSREVGLLRMLAGSSYLIYNANPSTPWPGSANLEVAIIHLVSGVWSGRRYLREIEVPAINDYLSADSTSGPPIRLVANSSLAYSGNKVYGEGFVLVPEEATRLIQRFERNRDVLFEYVRGEDMLTNPALEPRSWVINFGDRDIATAKVYEDCFRIVEQRVKPYRELVNRAHTRENWWLHEHDRPDLYRAVSNLDCVLFHAFTSKYLAFSRTRTDVVFAAPHVVIALDRYRDFAVLQSNLHEVWVRRYGSTLETRMRYTASDVFETFPRPTKVTQPEGDSVDSCGEVYYGYRSRLLISRSLGLTAAYNLFHDPTCRDADIDELRRLHVEMDIAVRDAFGWTDLALDHDFYGEGKETRFTISPKAKQEVLRRLLKLNHERAAEEERLGLSTKGKKAATSKSKRPAKASTIGTGDLFDLPVEAVEATAGLFTEVVPPIKHAQKSTNRDPVLFPWRGRERFMYEVIPMFVRLHPGERFEFYRRAATLASFPITVRRILLRQEDLSRVRQLDNLFPYLTQYAEDDDIRVEDIREQLRIDGNVEFDGNLGSGRLINPEAGQIVDDIQKSYLQLVLTALKLHIAAIQTNDEGALSLNEILEKWDMAGGVR